MKCTSLKIFLRQQQHPFSQEKMLIGHGTDHRMIHTVEHITVLPVTGAMVGKTYHKGLAPFLLPTVKQPAQLAVHIPQRRPVRHQTVVFLLFQIKIVGIVNRTHIQIQVNPSGIRILFQAVQDEINLIPRAFLHRTGKGRIPVTLFKKGRKHPAKRRAFVKKSHPADTPRIIAVRMKPLHQIGGIKPVSAFWSLLPHTNAFWKEEHLLFPNASRLILRRQKSRKNGMMRRIGEVSRRLPLLPCTIPV